MRPHEFAEQIGVSVETLRRWDRTGKLKAKRTPSNHRYCTEDDLAQAKGLKPISEERLIKVYCRVSSQKQKSELANQKAAMEQFCLARGYAVDEWIEEIGVLLNFKRRKFLKWAWADSIATEVKQIYSQLVTARQLNIARIKEQIKKKTKKAKTIFKSLSKVKNPTAKQQQLALGLKSKLLKIQSLKDDLKQLESTDRLSICFGSKKLFNAQHHLKENGYKNHDEWLADWKKKRGGRFFCIGKSQAGGGTMIKIFHVSGDDFKAVVTLPRFMQSEYGRVLEIPFQVNECRRRRKSTLLSALEQQKPITVQVFRREHKSDQWYIHLTTYVQ
jgi:predicted site-specific integrase-resolvase